MKHRRKLGSHILNLSTVAPRSKSQLKGSATTTIIASVLAILATAVFGCQTISDRRDVRPLVMRDVPAQRLAYRFEPDVGPPPEVSSEELIDKLETVQVDFTTRRPNDALIKTVISPDKQRVLALYSTENEAGSAFRLDLYSNDGKFLRNLTPPTLACAFPDTVSWSSDGNFITFIAHKAPEPAPTPTPPVSDPEALAEPSPSPSIAPAFPAVALFNTEQIYICNRDGYDLKPLTAREGLIYFYAAWAPDNHALVALACREPEWDAREREYKMPAGRPRLITLEGNERLLDDGLTEALPAWSTDSSKVAAAFDTDIAIYDAASAQPTQARIPLREQLISASVAYDEKSGGKKKADQKTVQEGPPASFNPIVRVEWPNPERLYFQTAYVKLIPNEPITTFPRWHRIVLSAQAAVLKR